MANDPEVEGFLALLAARRAPKTVDAYKRDPPALEDWLGGPPAKATPAALARSLPRPAGAQDRRRVQARPPRARRLVGRAAVEGNLRGPRTLARRSASGRPLPRDD